MRVSLFITCLVDSFFPSVGESMVKVLRRLGVTVTFDPRQTCCGQPAFNTGYRQYAHELAKRFLNIFAEADYIVAPSGSCVSMVKHYYGELFKDDPTLTRQAREVGARVYELSDFLVNVLGVEDVGARYHGRVTYHDACHLLRELRIKDEPRRLIRAVRDIEFVEMDNADQCCGFGGTFSVKLADVSGAMAHDKIEGIKRTNADVVVASDSSCLMQLAGVLSRRGLSIKPMHLAELLAMGD
ncbi:MAG: (Fe-S)-binding protein [Acidobacteriota bacterium]|nr:(Fe-S)-binding protein [Acidobacteriota bacterium]